MRKHTTPIITTILAAAAAQGSASAAAPVPADTVATALEGVQVTATRTQSALASSTPRHVVNAERVLTGGITDIADAMRRLPGVNIRDYGGSGGMKSVSVRGLGTQHTGIIYDGVALGDVQGGQIDLSRYSLDNLSAISLNVGDGDDIFLPARSVSTASTLSVSTLKSPDMSTAGTEGTLRLRAASFGTWNPYLRLGVSNGHNLSMAVTGDFIHARNDYPFTIVNGNERSRERRNNSQINSGHAEFDGIWKPTSASSLQAKGYWFDNSRHLPGPVIYYNNVSHERLHESNAFGQLSYGTRIGSIVSVKGLAKYNLATTRYRDENGRYPGGILDNRYTQREQYVSASVLVEPCGGLLLSYAADFWHNSLHSNLRGSQYEQRNSLLQALAIKWRVWRLTAVARGLLSLIHDYSGSASTGKDTRRLSPSVSVSVRPLEDRQWYVRASYKNVMRMPTFNELYFDHYGSINLSPETADQFNIGSTWSVSPVSWLPGLDITVDGYLNRVKNKIVAMPYNMFVWTMTNLGRVRVLGLDATVNADFRVAAGHDILVTGNYSYQRAAPRTDPSMSDWNKQVAYTPLNSGAWSVTWKNAWVNVVAHGSGCSARYSNNQNLAQSRIPGYMEVGLTLYREFRVGRRCALEARADMLNALDHQYEIIARYPMPGRSFALTLTARLLK